MNALPTELCLEVVSRVTRAKDLVNLWQVSKFWRGMVDDRFEKLHVKASSLNILHGLNFRFDL